MVGLAESRGRLGVGQGGRVVGVSGDVAEGALQKNVQQVMQSVA